MAAQWKSNFSIDLAEEKGRLRYGGAICYQGDSNSNVITIHLYENKVAYSGGGTVSGTCIRLKDGVTVPLTTGSISGNTITITLIANCFYAPGAPINVFVALTSGSTTTTVLSVAYDVMATTTNNVIDPSGEIALYVADLIEDIDEAKTVLDSLSIATVAETKTYLGWT